MLNKHRGNFTQIQIFEFWNEAAPFFSRCLQVLDYLKSVFNFILHFGDMTGQTGKRSN